MRAVTALIVAVAVAGCGGDSGGDDPDPELPYHRWHEPADEEDGPARVVLTLHGGTWILTGEEGAATMLPVVAELTEQGYTVLNGSYAPGADGIADVEALYALARERAEGPICVYGQSAGGSWALELAIREQSVTCVIAEAPPTDLEALARTSPEARAFLRRTFGPQLRPYSPIRGPFPPSTRILIAGLTDDWVVPWSQARRFRAAWPQTELVPLEPGAVPWVHGSAARESLRRYRRARTRFLSTAVGSGAAPRLEQDDEQDDDQDRGANTDVHRHLLRGSHG